MRVARLHLVMHRHEVGEERVVEARCWTATPGKPAAGASTQNR